MYCVRKVTKDVSWVGANDHRLHLFENIHPIPLGVSYNAYLLLDEKTVLFDTVDWAVCRQFLENVEHVLNGRDLDYMVINHMEPDHCASMEEIVLRYPNVKIISTEKSFMLMRQFGFKIDNQELIEVKEGDTTTFGKHTVTYVEAPMVHWPEAMVTLDLTDGILFSADAFGSFIALDANCSPMKSTLTAIGSMKPAVITPTSSANTALTYSTSWAKQRRSWIKSKSFARSMARSGEKTSAICSTNISAGARIHRKKKASSLPTLRCMATRKPLLRTWLRDFAKRALPISGSATFLQLTFRN